MEEDDDISIVVEVDGMRIRPVPDWSKLPTDEEWWVRCTDPDGNLVYDGLAPVPSELCTVSVEDALAGRLFTFRAIPVRNLN